MIIRGQSQAPNRSACDYYCTEKVLLAVAVKLPLVASARSLYVPIELEPVPERQAHTITARDHAQPLATSLSVVGDDDLLDLVGGQLARRMGAWRTPDDR